MSTYSFPVLKIKNILQCLQGIDLEMTVGELKEPDANQIIPVYERFLELLMGVTRDSLRMPQFSQNDVFEFPELHETSLAQMSWLKHMVKLLHAAGITDASLQDIFFPTYKRTRRILSGLINFAKFREEKLVTYEELTQATNDLLDKHAEYEDNSTSWATERQSVMAAHQELNPELTALTEETEALGAQVSARNEEQADIRERIHGIKKQYQEVGDQVANVSFNLLNAQQEQDQLRMQVVENPEQLKDTLAAMEHTIARTKSEVSALTEKLRGMQSRRQLLEKVNGKLTKRTSTMRECVGLVEQLKAQHSAVRDLADARSARQTEIDQLGEQHSVAREQVTRAQDRLFQLQREGEQKRHASEMALANIRTQRNELQRLMHRQGKEVSEIKANVARTRHETELLQEQHAQEMGGVAMKVERLKEAVRQYVAKLNSRMNDVSSGTDRSAESKTSKSVLQNKLNILSSYRKTQSKVGGNDENNPTLSQKSMAFMHVDLPEFTPKQTPKSSVQRTNTEPGTPSLPRARPTGFLNSPAVL